MKKITIISILLIALILLISSFTYIYISNNDKGNLSLDKKSDAVINNYESKKSIPADNPETKSKDKSCVTLTANGDLLYHDLLYMSARQDDGSYDFDINYKYVKDFISSADLAIADYEGTVDESKPLAGYPLFNAPSSVIRSIRDAGYDVMTLAQNHVLDSGIDGIFSTVQFFKNNNIDTFGVFTEPVKSKSNILVKEINGIKIALLAYCYGFNGNEAGISKSEYDNHLSDLNEQTIKSDLEKAEKLADITVVFPHMGVEYQLEPTNEQIILMDKMIDWGADIILGGHPHVMEPTKTVEKDGLKKFIIYSMGNFISNQRIETLDNKWTERGVLVELKIEKSGGKAYLSSVHLHPTWVSRTSQNRKSPDGFDLYDYSTLICKDVIENRSKYNFINDDMFERIKSAYNESLEFLNLDKYWTDK